MKAGERNFSPLAAAAVIYNTTGATLGETRLHIFKHGYLTTYRRTPTPHSHSPLQRASSNVVSVQTQLIFSLLLEWIRISVSRALC
jgi:hypothetical protein